MALVTPVRHVICTGTSVNARARCAVHARRAHPSSGPTMPPARRFALLSAALVAVGMSAAPLRAQTYGFDTLACGSGAGLGAYQGFTWFGFLCYDATLPNTGPQNTANGVISLLV